MDDRFAIGMVQLVLASSIGTVTAVTGSDSPVWVIGMLTIGSIWMLSQGAVALYRWCEETGYKPDGYATISFTGVCMACMGIQAGIQASHDYTYGIISVVLLGIGAVFMAGGYYEQ